MSNSRALAAFAVPWKMFVAAFGYYTGLTLLAIGMADLPVVFVAASYLLPIAVYAGVLLSRAVHALANLPVEIGDEPLLVLH